MSGTDDAAIPATAEEAAFDTTPAVVPPPAPVPAEAARQEAATPEPETIVAAPRDPVEALESAVRLAEAMAFASAEPVTARALGQLLPDDVDAATVLSALRERYEGRGVELVDVAGGFQFRTAADLAPALRKVVVVPRRLPRVAMETLAIIAYHQPVTRPEVEEMRGASLSQQTLDALLEADLIAPKGRKEAPGRPTLWGTTANFLAQFGLKDLRELPRREDLLVEPAMPASTPATLGPGQPDTPPGPEAAEAAAGAMDEVPEPAILNRGAEPGAPPPEGEGSLVPVPPESC